MALTSLLRPISAAELADLLSPVRTSMYAGGSVVLLRWCARCDQWMREGSAAAGRCVDCGAPREAPHQVVMRAAGERDTVESLGATGFDGAVKCSGACRPT